MRVAWPAIMALLWLFVVVRFVLGLPGGPVVRAVVALVILLIAEYHQITRRFFGTWTSPELPRGVLVTLAWAFGAFLLLAGLLLLRDIFGAAASLIAPRFGHVILNATGVRRVIVVLAVVGAVYGVWQSIRLPRVKTLEVRLRGLASAFDGYRVIQLTDLHASRFLPAKWMAGVVARVNALQPDLIVITGDIADGAPAARTRDVAPLGGLKAVDGVLAIPGNHEYYSDYRGSIAAYRRLGLHFLENQHVRIRRGGAALAVAGVTDVAAVSLGLPGPDLAKAVAGIDAAVPVILLRHRPGDATRMARTGVSLQLSGHTHGGQVPGLATVVRRSNHGFVSGHYELGGMQLYVSNGTGLWNGFALRFGRPSEITRLVLHPRNGE